MDKAVHIIGDDSLGPATTASPTLTRPTKGSEEEGQKTNKSVDGAGGDNGMCTIPGCGDTAERPKRIKVDQPGARVAQRSAELRGNDDVNNLSEETIGPDCLFER